MTTSELVAAVQPCLPLPGIQSVALTTSVTEISYVTFNGGIDEHLGDAARLVKGAIADACAERGWWAIRQELTATTITVHDPTGCKLARPFSAEGTDAIAWCKAYAAAMKGGAA